MTEKLPSLTEVRFEHTPNLPSILRHVRAALAITTYQAGKLLVIGVENDSLAFSFHNIDQAMGLAVSPEAIALGSRRDVHLLKAAHDAAPTLAPSGTFDACWLARQSFRTGNIHGHELAWGRDGLWMVNTLFSCLCTFHDDFSFVPRWRPPFITELSANDRCHLNGLAMLDGRPKYVTAHGDSNEPGGWRPAKATGGVVIDVESGKTIARGFAMPHSPRLANGRLWVLNSGAGQLGLLDPATGRFEIVETFPGYARGLTFQGQFAFVGLSKIRETSVFGGMPLEPYRHELRCGVAVVDLVSGKTVATLQFHSGVDEIFAVEGLPNCLRPFVAGPQDIEPGEQDKEHAKDVWIVPPPGREPATGSGIFGNSRLTEIDHITARAALPPVALHKQGRLQEARQAFEQALQREPLRADLHCDLGNVWQSLGDQQQALACYRRAIECDPDCIAARQNLGYLALNHGDPDEAIRQYGHVNRLHPTPISRLLDATVLPVVCDSLDEMNRWRERLESKVRTLAEEGVRIDTTAAEVPTSFFLAYHGRNDRDVMRQFGRIYQGVELCRSANGQPLKPRVDGKLKVGFLSAYFRDHTIGRLNLGRVRHLDRSRFEVTVLHAGRHGDAMAQAFDRAADRTVHLPRDVQAARRMIAEQDLDILIFADVGMDALTYTLAYSRMAPVQIATWGHPDTTGSPTMDYFLSSELLELDGAIPDSHYSERLVRLPLLSTYYERPYLVEQAASLLPAAEQDKQAGSLLYGRSRAFFGLDDTRHIYLCPQTLFKFHPDFDEVLAGILSADPNGELVLLDGRVPRWTELLKQRFARTLPDSDHRVRFLPALPNNDFLALLQTADVILDPLHFGGGNTSYEAFAMGTPVVTWPSDFLRGRITAALYAKMKFTDLIVTSADEYVRLAVQLGTHRDFHEQTRLRLRETASVLFDDLEEVRTLEEFLWSLTE